MKGIYIASAGLYKELDRFVQSPPYGLPLGLHGEFDAAQPMASELEIAHQSTVEETMNARRISIAIPAFAALLSLSACVHIGHMFGTGAERPDASEFGMGPRRSANGLFTASLEADKPLSVGRMHQVRLSIKDQDGKGIDDGLVYVDGGMPEHGHGLPTEPRVTRRLGNGAYLVDGVKFNMGGWWVLSFAVVSSAGNDTLRFNIDL
jgi:hypothetical protein